MNKESQILARLKHEIQSSLRVANSRETRRLSTEFKDLTKLRQRRQRERLKLYGFIWAKQHLCTYIKLLICTFLCRPCTTTTWNDQILSWLENGNSKAIKFTFSLWPWTRSPLFSSNLTSLLSSNWVTWHKGEKLSKDAKSIFQRCFHWCRRCRIVRSLL